MPSAIQPINAARLWDRLQRIAAFTSPGIPWTRRAFSNEFVQGRAWLKAEFERVGLTTHIDPAGNLIGRLEGSNASLKPICTGSHTDTVLRGGRFDGVLGVLAGLEVAQSFKESGSMLRHPLEIIDFLAEEPTDHGVSCVGSRGFVGALDSTMLAQTDPCGETLSAAISRMGGQPDYIDQAARTTGDVAAFLELHIEQGRVLETDSLPIGVVTHIVGIRRVSIKVHGRPDHAGTTPMALRQDALVGAAHVVSTVRTFADGYREGPSYVVATVGRLNVTPNAANSVPGLVEMTLEVRSDSSSILETFAELILAACQPELARLKVHAAIEELTLTTPTFCDPMIKVAIKAAAGRLGLESRRLPSGAGHDALHIARVGPIGMIFVPCREGRSHCPEEWIDSDQAAAGARVLAGTIVELDNLLT
ncbi:Zn-dependent hydrolase [Acidovorax sp. NPDC077693]|uniref:Zn-dependent hydrolase n=1 Tax=unclassified Acidovorax TaxID=2684926 RepID=UPI0037CC5826